MVKNVGRLIFHKLHKRLKSNHYTFLLIQLKMYKALVLKDNDSGTSQSNQLGALTN